MTPCAPGLRKQPLSRKLRTDIVIELLGRHLMRGAKTNKTHPKPNGENENVLSRKGRVPCLNGNKLLPGVGGSGCRWPGGQK